jgi:hypothetical protein
MTKWVCGRCLQFEVNCVCRFKGADLEDVTPIYRAGQENAQGQCLDMVKLVRTELLDASSSRCLDRVETLIRMIRLEAVK